MLILVKKHRISGQNVPVSQYVTAPSPCPTSPRSSAARPPPEEWDSLRPCTLLSSFFPGTWEKGCLEEPCRADQADVPGTTGAFGSLPGADGDLQVAEG